MINQSGNEVMRSNFLLVLLLCMIAVTSHAQNDQPTSLTLGDPAPPLRVRAWLKGAPIQRFEKGNIYVVEFWATWCGPCIAAMPHFSALAREYKDRVTILGIDIMEMKTSSMEKVKAFVDSMGYRMDYHVAAEDSNFMEADWFEASGERGIPKSFVVNAEGRVAWIGHPNDLAKVLPKLVNNTWDIKEALAKRNSDKLLRELDSDAQYELMRYEHNMKKPDAPEKTDSILLAINEIVRNEPKLKYAPIIASRTFSALLKTDPHKACEYGKQVIVIPTYEDPAYGAIISGIEFNTDKLNLPAEIYQLGAEAYQAEIDQFPYPELLNLPKRYNIMAEWYCRANDKSKAINSQQKAIEALKRKKDYSATEMTAFESRLQQYKNL
jgi:thiol-disulfide isomerase/thioredoxin